MDRMSESASRAGGTAGGADEDDAALSCEPVSFDATSCELACDSVEGASSKLIRLVKSAGVSGVALCFVPDCAIMLAMIPVCGFPAAATAFTHGTNAVPSPIDHDSNSSI